MSVAIIPGMSGYGEVLLILVAILLLFGYKRIPELSRSLGRSLSEFKRGRQEGARSLEEVAAKSKPTATDEAGSEEQKKA